MRLALLPFRRAGNFGERNRQQRSSKMAVANSEEQVSAAVLRQKQIDQYWAGDLARRAYLFRRQRKAILESCRRIAVVGASGDPSSASFIAIERLLGMGLEMIPVFPGRESLLGLRCYGRLRDVPGHLDIVQVFPDKQVDYEDLARDAVIKAVNTLWLEPGLTATKEVQDILVGGRVQLVEYENLENEYLKHVPSGASATAPSRKDKKAVKVKDRMSRNPVTVKPDDGINDAIWKMERGHFRHLPVIDEAGKLIGMLSDRDVRLVRPSLALVDKDEANVQLWSIAVQQAAVFEPVKVTPETTVKEAAELMLRWQVGGLPVVGEKDKLIGIITYTDLLREFVGHEQS
jgi:CBS domain-containing protein/predicted CoA-binding protein